MELYDGTSTLTSGKAYHPNVIVSTSSQIAWHKIAINTAGGLLPDTEYRGTIRQYHYIRVKSATIYETASQVANNTNDGAVNPADWETHKPIYDAPCQEIAETATLLWQHNAAHLLSWTREDVASAPTVTGTTEVNLLDTSITGGTWSATTPGFVLNTEFHNTTNGDVPVVLGVYATRTFGTGSLVVRVKRNGSTIITATVTTGAAPFDSSAYTITARASDKIDITIAADKASEIWRIDAIGLWEYEA